MSTYRKVTIEELTAIGYVPNKTKYEKHIDFAKKYYPDTAVTMVISIHSEYNDNTYDNSTRYIIVLDKDGNELPPLKATAKKCREEWYKLPIPGTHANGYSRFETDEHMDDVVIPLTTAIPEFYVKID